MFTQSIGHMPVEMCMAEIVGGRVTGAELDYQGSITIDPAILETSQILPGQMVYIDDLDRPVPPWRTYTVPGSWGKGEIIMNGPPAHHFRTGDCVTVRAGVLLGYNDASRITRMRVELAHTGRGSNQIYGIADMLLLDMHWRQMCISKLHRLVVTKTYFGGPETLLVDEDILDAAGFPSGIEVQFTSLKNGAIRRTCIQAGPRGTGMAAIHGAGAQYIEPGTRLVTLAEAWLPYDEAVKIGGPQVAFFDEARTDMNVIREIKPGYRPS